MKKNLTLICAAFAACAFLSCTKENAEVIIDDVQQEVAPVEEVTVSATLSDVMTKVGFAPSYDANGKPTAMTLTWAEGDQLRVYNHDDRTKFNDFTLDATSVGQKKGTFTGTPSNLQGATKFDVEVVGAEGFSYSAQTQPADGVASDLKYLASVSAVSNYDNVEFTEFSSVLAITAKMPEGVAAKVKSVTVKASENIFDGANNLTVTLAEVGDAGADGILHVFATLPQGSTVIPSGTTLVAHFNAPGEEHDVYTRFVELGSDLSFAENKLNTININAVNSADYANASAENIGSEANPYLVGDKYQFNAIRNELAAEMKYFEMVDDIDMTGIAWNPINKDAANTIHFEGNGYTISNVAPAEHLAYQSIFGILSGTVQNLNVDKAVMVPGGYPTGVLASHLGASASTVVTTVSNVKIANSTIGTASAMTTGKSGILAGFVENPNGAVISDVVISDCIIASTNYAGGLIGQISQTTAITDVKVQGTDVYGNLSGGVISYIYAASTMKGCVYTGGTVTSSSSHAGGLVGSAANFATVITDCHVPDATIDVSAATADSQRCGGFIGNMEKSVVIKGCTVGTETKRVVVKAGNPSNDSKAVNSGGFVGVGYGVITKNGDARCKAYVTFTCANTKNKRINVGGFIGYHQSNTIEYCDADVVMEGMAGSYIGGFAGANIDSNIENCTVKVVLNGGNTYIGGFVGEVDKGGFVNCTASGTMTNSAATAGGFVGGSAAVSAAATYTDCKSSVIINSNKNVGGFTGTAVGTFTSCHASGSVTCSGGSVGGFAGRTLEASNVTFSKCYATGAVQGKANTAGFIGYFGGDCTVSNCYAAGNVNGLDQKAGGFVGYTLDSAANIPNGVTITNCYASGEVRGAFTMGGFLGRMGLPNVTIDKCVVWSPVVQATTIGAENWSTGAFVGVTYPGCTITNCYRNPNMDLTAYWVPAMDSFQHPDVTVDHPLTDSAGEEMTDTKPVSGQPHYPQYPYHAKVDATKTLSALTRDVLGWSADIWDFSKDLPTLK